MSHIHTVIIGGGQAGLAMSRCLTDAGVEHVVLERGRVAERWRSERWDSLRLLTPRWQSRLPGWSYDGPDPDGYMSRDEVVRYLEGYAASFRAPVEAGVAVTAVVPHRLGFRVTTDRGSWTAANVVVATGESQSPRVPRLAEALPPDIRHVVPTRYRHPGELDDGGVLVVGASSTGVQLAAEIHASGRPVTLAVGRHTRLPRTYRERDILWWFERMGILSERAHEVEDLDASRGQPSMQLIGSPDRRSLDLGILHEAGLRMVGRAAGVEDGVLAFEDDLVETTAAADVKLAKLRLRIDAYIRAEGLAGDVGPEEPFVPVRLPDPPTRLDLGAEGIRTVLWATGFRRRYPWLKVGVLDGRGEIRHTGGVTPVPGLYVLGLNLLRRRNSSFIDGVARDAEELAEHLVRRRAVPGGAVPDPPVADRSVADRSVAGRSIAGRSVA